MITNADGRTDGPVLKNEDSKAGEYELLFYIDEYYDEQNLPPGNPRFVDRVPVRFTVVDPSQHYPRADAVHPVELLNLIGGVEVGSPSPALAGEGGREAPDEGSVRASRRRSPQPRQMSATRT